MNLYKLSKFNWLRSGWWETGDLYDRFNAIHPRGGHVLIHHPDGRVQGLYFIVSKSFTSLGEFLCTQISLAD